MQKHNFKNITFQGHRRQLPNGLKLFIMISPFIVFIFAFNYVPLFGWVYAFFDYKPGIPLSHTQFTGLLHFKELLGVGNGGDMVRVLRNTLAMSTLNIIASPLPAIFAILLNEVRSTKFKKLVQTTTTLPNFISWIIVFGLAFAIFSNEGLLNNLLLKLGLPISETNILANDNATWLFQWSLGIWKSIGWQSIIYLATITGIDVELYDAIKVDGANRLQTAIHVTVPGLYPTFLVLLLLSVSNILNNGFDQYFVFYNPLVADRLEVLDYYVYKIGLLTNDYPLSTAIGMSKTIISLILLFFANGISRKIRGVSIV